MQRRLGASWRTGCSRTRWARLSCLSTSRQVQAVLLQLLAHQMQGMTSMSHHRDFSVN